MGTKAHKKKAPAKVRVGILTVSSTRSLETDKSGLWIRKGLQREGHEVHFHEVVGDDAFSIAEVLLSAIRENNLQAVLVTGGTGIADKDVTIEAIQPLFNKELTAFGPLFGQLSYEEIDSAAMLSRATAGLIGKTVVFCMPGSLNACKMACRALIFPELGHLLHHVETG